MNFDSMYSLYHIRERDVKSTHMIHTLISDLFVVVKSCVLRGEGRRDNEKSLRYGVKINHMITFESREFIFLFLHFFTSYPFILQVLKKNSLC